MSNSTFSPRKDLIGKRIITVEPLDAIKRGVIRASQHESLTASKDEFKVFVDFDDHSGTHWIQLDDPSFVNILVEEALVSVPEKGNKRIGLHFTQLRNNANSGEVRHWVQILDEKKELKCFKPDEVELLMRSQYEKLSLISPDVNKITTAHERQNSMHSNPSKFLEQRVRVCQPSMNSGRAAVHWKEGVVLSFDDSTRTYSIIFDGESRPTSVNPFLTEVELSSGALPVQGNKRSSVNSAAPPRYQQSQRTVQSNAMPRMSAPPNHATESTHVQGMMPTLNRTELPNRAPLQVPNRASVRALTEYRAPVNSRPPLLIAVQNDIKIGEQNLSTAHNSAPRLQAVTMHNRASMPSGNIPATVQAHNPVDGFTFLQLLSQQNADTYQSGVGEMNLGLAGNQYVADTGQEESLYMAGNTLQGNQFKTGTSQYAAGTDRMNQNIAVSHSQSGNQYAGGMNQTGNQYVANNLSPRNQYIAGTNDKVNQFGNGGSLHVNQHVDSTGQQGNQYNHSQLRNQYAEGTSHQGIPYTDSSQGNQYGTGTSQLNQFTIGDLLQGNQYVENQKMCTSQKGKQYTVGSSQTGNQHEVGNFSPGNQYRLNANNTIPERILSSQVSTPQSHNMIVYQATTCNQMAGTYQNAAVQPVESTVQSRWIGEGDQTNMDSQLNQMRNDQRVVTSSNLNLGMAHQGHQMKGQMISNSRPEEVILRSQLSPEVGNQLDKALQLNQVAGQTYQSSEQNQLNHNQYAAAQKNACDMLIQLSLGDMGAQQMQSPATESQRREPIIKFSDPEEDLTTENQRISNSDQSAVGNNFNLSFDGSSGNHLPPSVNQTVASNNKNENTTYMMKNGIRFVTIPVSESNIQISSDGTLRALNHVSNGDQKKFELTGTNVCQVSTNSGSVSVYTIPAMYRQQINVDLTSRGLELRRSNDRMNSPELPHARAAVGLMAEPRRTVANFALSNSSSASNAERTSSTVYPPYRSASEARSAPANNVPVAVGELSLSDSSLDKIDGKNYGDNLPQTKALDQVSTSLVRQRQNLFPASQQRQMLPFAPQRQRLPTSTPQQRPMLPNSSHQRQRPPSTSQARQMLPSTSQPRQMPPSTLQPRQMPPSTSQPRQMLPSTSQPRLMPPSTSQPRQMLPSTSQQRPILPASSHQRQLLPSASHQRQILPPTSQQRQTLSSASQQRQILPSASGFYNIRNPTCYTQQVQVRGSLSTTRPKMSNVRPRSSPLQGTRSPIETNSVPPGVRPAQQQGSIPHGIRTLTPPGNRPALPACPVSAVDKSGTQKVNNVPASNKTPPNGLHDSSASTGTCSPPISTKVKNLASSRQVSKKATSSGAKRIVRSPPNGTVVKPSKTEERATNIFYNEFDLEMKNIASILNMMKRLDSSCLAPDSDVKPTAKTEDEHASKRKMADDGEPGVGEAKQMRLDGQSEVEGEVKTEEEEDVKPKPMSDCETKVDRRRKEMSDAGEHFGNPSEILSKKHLNGEMKLGSGAKFVQDRPCFELASNLLKCRECKAAHGKVEKMGDVSCRFVAFRRLHKKNNGTMKFSGFSEPCDADADDICLWLPILPIIEPSMDTDMAKYIISNVGNRFCELVEQEKDAMSWVSVNEEIAWKRPVYGIREMCDVCNTTLFNVHWVCPKCGYVVCLDCYRTITHKRTCCGSIDVKCQSCERGQLKWLKCSSDKKPHTPNDMKLTQIIPSDVLWVVGRMIHDVRKKWKILVNCPCGESQEEAEESEESDLSTMMNETLGLISNEHRNQVAAIETNPMKQFIESKVGKKCSSNNLAASFVPLPLDVIIKRVNAELKPRKPHKPTPKKDVRAVRAPSPKDNHQIYRFDINETRLQFPDIPHNWLDGGRLLQLLDSKNPRNIELFQQQWRNSQPVQVSNCDRFLNKKLWLPEAFAKEFGKLKNDLVDCANKIVLENYTMSLFWEGFESVQKRLKDANGQPVILKLKDWPPTADFSEMLPERFKDLMGALPLPEYVHRTGVFNIVSRLPEFFVRPDLGPKMYNAYGSALYPQVGSTNLHLDVSDAVNLILYVGIPTDDTEDHQEAAIRAMREAGCCELTMKRVLEEGARPGALWHIYDPHDSDKIRELLSKVGDEIGEPVEAHTDPIHDQSWYLDEVLRERLLREYNVEGYTLMQCVGDSIFIPAGAPHQVRNLHSCIKAAEDFVSPENLDYCFRMTQEFRHLSDTHTNHEDKLQVKNIIYHAVKDAIAVLQNEDLPENT